MEEFLFLQAQVIKYHNRKCKGNERRTFRKNLVPTSGHSYCRSRRVIVKSFLDGLIFSETDLTHFPFIR